MAGQGWWRLLAGGLAPGRTAWGSRGDREAGCCPSSSSALCSPRCRAACQPLSRCCCSWGLICTLRLERGPSQDQRAVPASSWGRGQGAKGEPWSPEPRASSGPQAPSRGQCTPGSQHRGWDCLAPWSLTGPVVPLFCSLLFCPFSFSLLAPPRSLLLPAAYNPDQFSFLKQTSDLLRLLPVFLPQKSSSSHSSPEHGWVIELD